MVVQRIFLSQIIGLGYYSVHGSFILLQFATVTSRKLVLFLLNTYIELDSCPFGFRV